MRNRAVTLLDLGLDDTFFTAMEMARCTLSNINVAGGPSKFDVNYVRSRDPETILAALTSDCTVLHIMAHAGDDGASEKAAKMHWGGPGFASGEIDGEPVDVALRGVAEYLADQKRGIIAPIVIADGCRTGTASWLKAIRECLEGDVMYLGTSKDVGWYETGVFTSAFYAALARNKGKGVTPQEQGAEAARRAEEAFRLITDRKSPYRPARALTPSRRAEKALA